MHDKFPTRLPEDAEQAERFLAAYGAMKRGHFVLASGRHSAHYVNKSKLVERPRELDLMIRQRSEELAALGRIDLVLSPAMGGVPVGQQVGLVLGARAIYSERDADDAMVLKRGFGVGEGERVLLVEDVITTGGTLKELRRFVEGEGAEIAGVFAIVNRSGRREWSGFPLVSCIELEFPTYAVDEVPGWLAEIEAERPGTKKV